MSRRALLGAMTALLWTTAAHADEASDLEQLLDEPVVTTASKAAEASSAAPGTSSTITAEDLRRYGIHTLDEALDFLSLGAFTQSSLRDSDVGTRGVMFPGDQGSHVLLLVNGHPMNEPLFGAARFGRGLGIPMEIVDHIEVVLGPGSVLYGSNAMLGVVNVVTKRSKDLAPVSVWADSELGKSWRAGAAGSLELTLGRSRVDLTAGVEYFRQDGPSLRFADIYNFRDPSRFGLYRSGRDVSPDGHWGGLATKSLGAEVPTAFATLNVGNLELNVHASTYKRSAPYEDRESGAATYFDDPAHYEVDRHAWLDAHYRIPVSRKLEIVARVYGDTFNYQRYSDSSFGAFCALGTVDACRWHVVGASQWAGVEPQLRYDWFADARFTTLIGVDGRMRHVASKTDVFNYDTGEHVASSYGLVDANDQIAGAYVQQTWQATHALGLNAGSRIDYDPRFRAVGSPRLAAAYQPWSAGTLKAVYAEAFRAPSWGETSYASSAQLVAHGLAPERVRSIEGGFEQRFGANRAMVSLFRSWWADSIELRELSVLELSTAQRAGLVPLEASLVRQYSNVSEINNYGFNAVIDGEAFEHKLRFGVNVTGAIATRVATAENTERPLLAAPRFFANARVSYDLPGHWPTLAIAGQLVGTRGADGAYERGFVPPPSVPTSVQLRGTVSGDLLWVQGLSYRISAHWVSINRTPYIIGPNQADDTGFDPKYGEATSGATLPPVDTFRATIGLHYEFGR